VLGVQLHGRKKISVIDWSIHNLAKGKGEKAFNYILDMVKNGIYAKGSKLPTERELAAQLGIGRNLLREIITRLNSIGILEVRERQGIYVKEFAKNDIDNLQNLNFWPPDFIPQLTEMRIIVCVPAAQLAALRRTDEDLGRMRDCIEMMKTCKNRTEEEQVESNRLDDMMHMLVVKTSHNDIIVRTYEGLASLIEKSNSFMHIPLLLKEGWFDHVIKQEMEIFDAIASRQPEKAAAVMKEHIVDTIEEIYRTSNIHITQLQNAYWKL
jgi:GntR family transcriptional repressor for pyruvate dehydrogenase complex